MHNIQHIQRGVLTPNQLFFLHHNFNWTSEDILIINFTHPLENCHYNQYQHLKESRKWWTDFYSKIDLSNVANRFIYSDARAARKVIDSTTSFADNRNFVLNTFFSTTKYCYGVAVINKKGEFEIKGSEYSEEEVQRYISRLTD